MLTAPDGRLRIEVDYPFGVRKGDRIMHRSALAHHLLACCAYFGIDEQDIGIFLPSQTPFGISTDLVCSLLTHVERNGQPFMETFLASKVNEFFLFGTYLLYLGHRLEDHYEWSPAIGAGLWTLHDNGGMQRTISHATDRCFFSVHRWTFHMMDMTTQHMLAALWHERKLFASYDEALGFLRDCAITYRPIGCQ
jgi:hypothetical protein